ncbi:DUF47 domain-containing protein [Phytoactinopolyspora halotolerans]|uniref:DUF47 family protein n=1 Tax=Phytoactinopolyspora halotolerans TaxID=1981512 RepID=A0A6L9S4M4_9ACTN|nr:DUF47 family protein [Phytoactinopolyspora halotolerans]
MRMRLSQGDSVYYDLFTAAAQNVRNGVGVLSEALVPDADRAALVPVLKDIEHTGDEHTHDIVRRVNSGLKPPFHRDDIYRLAGALDDVLDDVEAALDLMVLYRIRELPNGIAAMIDVLDRAADLTAEAMPRLRAANELTKYWIEINRLENEADQTYRRLLARIFSGEYDALTVHKLKDVIETLESAVDGFERVANVVEQIALKQS